jgi:hypothetical protein
VAGLPGADSTHGFSIIAETIAAGSTRNRSIDERLHAGMEMRRWFCIAMRTGSCFLQADYSPMAGESSELAGGIVRRCKA